MEKSTSTVLRGGNGGNAISLTRPWKRGQRYGAMVVDLERKRPIALLPDRSQQTVIQWLKRYPTINIVARDRSKVRIVDTVRRFGREVSPQLVLDRKTVTL